MGEGKSKDIEDDEKGVRKEVREAELTIKPVESEEDMMVTDEGVLEGVIVASEGVLEGDMVSEEGTVVSEGVIESMVENEGVIEDIVVNDGLIEGIVVNEGVIEGMVVNEDVSESVIEDMIESDVIESAKEDKTVSEGVIDGVMGSEDVSDGVIEGIMVMSEGVIEGVKEGMMVKTGKAGKREGVREVETVVDNAEESRLSSRDVEGRSSGMELASGVGMLADDDGVGGVVSLRAVRLIVSFTDRGDDMSFPISFIISVLPGTHCTTSDSTLLLLLLSEIVYLHVGKTT